MRILYFTQLFYPYLFGGGEVVLYQWAKELTKRGHQVFVITQRLENTKTNETLDGIEIYRVGSEIKSGSELALSFSSNLSFLVSSFFKGMEIARKKKIDIIHSNTYVPVISARWCASLLRRPHIATVHDVYSLRKDFWKDWTDQPQTSKANGLIGPMIEKMVAKTHVSLFHTVSETSKSDLQELGVTKNIIVIPNGIEPEKYQTKSTTKNQAIFVGRLVFYKNLDVVIGAFKKVVQKDPTSRLVIVGEGPYKEKLIERSENLGLQNNVSFVGHVSDAEKIKLIAESRVLVNPSLVEGFGIVILESFACGRPVIVSDVKPLSDLVTETKDGFIIPPTDTTKWSQSISELLSNEAKAISMGLAGREKVLASYTVSRNVENLESLYKSVL
jgi:glycosyltransferase involved in cell wall biosynthesis